MKHKRSACPHNLCRLIGEASPVPMLVISQEGKILEANPAFERLSERSGLILHDTDTDTLFVPEEGDRSVGERVNTLSELGERCSLSLILPNKKKQSVDLFLRPLSEIDGTPVLIAIGAPPLFTDNTTDNPEKTAAALSLSGVVFEEFIDSEGQEQYLFFDGDVKELLGHSKEALLDTPTLLRDYMYQDAHTRQYYRKKRNAILNYSLFTADVRILRDGEARWIRLRGQARPAQNGTIINGLIMDVTEQKLTEERLSFLSFHDPVTGTGNRTFLLNQFHEMRQHTPRIAAMLIAPNKLKDINLRQGHEAGNITLSRFIARISETLPQNAVIGRVSGTRFLILLPSFEKHDCLAQLDKMQHNLLRPLLIKGSSVMMQMTAGIAFYPQDAVDAESLFQKSETAFYAAKKDDNNSAYFLPALEKAEEFRTSVEEKIIDALEKDQVTAFFQPQVNLKTGQIESLEALARIVGEDGFILPPAAFIPVAEESHLIVSITERMAEKAMEQTARWKKEKLLKGPVYINIPPNLLRTPDRLHHILTHALHQYKLDPTDLGIEITESSAATELESALPSLRDLTDAGLGWAIDDFGTGYSAFSLLRRFPKGHLKIDRSFISQIEQDESDKALVSSIINMATILGFTPLVEGIETTGQASLLRNLGCFLGQGFLFEKPLPPDETTHFLRERHLEIPPLLNSLP